MYKHKPIKYIPLIYASKNDYNYPVYLLNVIK